MTIGAICGELYPPKYRDVCVSLATGSNWTWNFLMSFFTPFIQGKIHFEYGYVFGGCCGAGAIIAFFCVNESYGRTLEEIDTMYVQHVKPWKSKNWVAPHDLRDRESGGQEEKEEEAAAAASTHEQAGVESDVSAEASNHSASSPAHEQGPTENV